MPVPSPLQPNRWRWKCQKCGEMVSPGKGMLRRSRWCDTTRDGKWYFEHPGCPGTQPGYLTVEGWVYAMALIGETRRSIVKVGQSGRPNVMDRVLSMGIDGHPTQVWCSNAKNRYQAELQVHAALTPHRVVGLFGYNREYYIAPLDEVLVAIHKATGVEPTMVWVSITGWDGMA
jgi:hypothetical protein